MIQRTKPEVVHLNPERYSYGMALIAREHPALLTNARIQECLDQEFQTNLLRRLAQDRENRTAVLLVRKYLEATYPSGIGTLSDRHLQAEILSLFQTVGMQPEKWKQQIPAILEFLRKESNPR